MSISTRTGGYADSRATVESTIENVIVVDGEVEKDKAADETAADDDNRIVNSGDGTVTVVGSTGDNAGDAYILVGQFVSFEKTGGSSGFEHYWDRVAVTDDLP